jgi:hypothetical protein
MHPDTSLNTELHLQKLHRWLTAGGLSALLGTGAYFVPYGIIMMVLIVAAVVFTPYMLWSLYQCRRFGWIAAFGVLVLLPALLAVALSPGGVAGFLLAMLPLFNFYLFTWVLRHAVGEWLENLRGQRMLRQQEQRAEADARLAGFHTFR